MKNLNYLVQNYKLSLGLVSTDHDQQFLQWFIGGMRELNTKYKMIDQAIKTVSLDISNGQATIPSDFQDFIRIGICCNGVWINFDMNDDICTDPSACPCDADTISSTIQACCNGGAGYDSWFYPGLGIGQPWSYSYTAGSYAIGPGFYHGGYMIDKQNGIIRFDSCVTAQSGVLEYVGDFMTEMGNALVTDALINPLTDWAEYQRKKFSPDARLRAEAPRAYSTFYQGVRDVNSIRNAMNKQAWVQLIRKYTYQGIKS